MIDDIDDPEKQTLEFLDILVFTQSFDRNISYISQGTCQCKNNYYAPNQTNQYGHSPYQRVLRSVNLFQIYRVVYFLMVGGATAVIWMMVHI